ncbi:hypothetical protein DFH08DRAFT_941176 [Mycena albidolilacea]|uniref:Uncharacterized protein n=1 Tax=Mycena albidolilacea TaxID=1033008 RepID=A0AAD7EJ37_9AGAR|nr:hypothetical protein DFH08DRAFT_941176 [Mycena albidolilacea]
MPVLFQQLEGQKRTVFKTDYRSKIDLFQLGLPMAAPNDLLIHHRHLETLLDFALATLSTPYTPIRAHHRLAPLLAALAGSPPSPQQSDHTHLDYDPDPDPDPDRPRSPHDPPPAPRSAATYAAAIVSAGVTNTAEHPIANPATRRVPAPASRHARVIIRPVTPLKRPSGGFLHGKIAEALEPLMGRLDVLGHAKGSLGLAGVEWTRSGNIALHPGTECTSKLLASHCEAIWAVHSVVFHGVPVPLHFGDLYRWDFIDEWVTTSLSQGTLRDHSVLCRIEDIEQKRTVPLRLSFSSEADAERLIKNGGYIYGTPCRVTCYIPRPHSPPPPSPPV